MIDTAERGLDTEGTQWVDPDSITNEKEFHKFLWEFAPTKSENAHMPMVFDPKFTDWSGAVRALQEARASRSSARQGAEPKEAAEGHQGHLGTGSDEGVALAAHAQRVDTQSLDGEDSRTSAPSLDEATERLEGRQGHPGTGSEKGVPLGAILDEVAALNKRFIFHKDESTHDVIALWVAHTFAMDRWSITPRLYINAPQAGVGKSTQGQVIKYLSNNGIKSGSATMAYIFGKVKEYEGALTVLLDEADNIWAKGKDTSDLQALINEGYEYGATVGRGNATDAGIVGNSYDAYCPVAIIGIKNSRIPATTLSRCINIKMTLPGNGSRIERFIARKHEPLCSELRERIQEAAARLPEYEPMDPPDWLSLREWDIWEPLFIIAREAGGDWPERVDRASRALNGLEPVLSPAQRVLRFTFEYLREVHRATPQEIADYVNEQDDMFDVDAQRVSYYLKTYDVESSKSNGRRVFTLDEVMPVAEQWLPEQTHPVQKPTLAVPADPGSSPSGPVETDSDGLAHAPQKPSLAVPADPAPLDADGKCSACHGLMSWQGCEVCKKNGGDWDSW